MKEGVAVLFDVFSWNPGRGTMFRFVTFGTRTQQASAAKSACADAARVGINDTI
jgi:hypothetical protein